MIIRLENSSVRAERKINYVTKSRAKVMSNKIFTLKDVILLSITIFTAGLTLGIAIMQIMSH